MKKTINLLLLLVMFSPSVLGQMKIGHVNSQKLLDTLPSRKQAMLELKKFENDPYEKRSFLYLDVLSYLESKIEGKPLRDIIKEKAISLNRKEKQSTKHS